MKVIMNTHARIGLLALCILMSLGIQNITAASSSLAATDKFSTVPHPTMVVTPSPLAGTTVKLTTANVPKPPRQMRFTKSTLRQPALLINATIPIELRGLIYIADRIKCSSGYFEAYPSPIANDVVLVTCLTLLTYKFPKEEAMRDLSGFLQEFGHIHVPTQGPPSITGELKEQYKRIKCMLRLIKILPATVPIKTHGRYKRLHAEPHIDDRGNPYYEFETIYDTSRHYFPIPTRQLQQNFRLFTTKAVALTTIKTAKQRLANLL